jgi:hypothetical protein
MSLTVAEVGEKFLKFANCLTVLAGARVDLAPIKMRDNSKSGSTVHHGSSIFEATLDVQHATEIALRAGIVPD